jgi:hypothetical protein
MRAAVAAVTSAVVLAACGHGTARAPERGGGTAERAAPYTAAQLRAALLTGFGRVNVAVPAQFGRYGSLRGVQVTRATIRGVRIIPARCARATRTGLDSAALARVPASVVSFRDGSGGVSEVLLAPPGKVAAQALGHPVPRACAHYRAVVGGRMFAYTVREVPAPHIGAAAREVNVHADGGARVDVWTVIYRATGYVGAITLVGPAATRADVESIARMAYARAQQALEVTGAPQPNPAVAGRR